MNESIVIAGYNNEQDSEPARVEIAWSDLMSSLSEVRETDCAPCIGKQCAHKYGQAWSPVDIPEGKSRANDNVLAVTVAVFDIDHVTRDALDALRERLVAHEYLIHSTHSHREHDYCLRLVMRLSNPVARADWPAFLRTIIKRFDIPADPQTKDISRLYFLPTAPKGAPTLVERHEGEALDVQRFVGTAQQDVGVDPDLVVETPEFKEAHAVDVDALRAIVQEVKRRKARSLKDEDKERHDALVRLLNDEPLASPGARDGTVNRVASMLACCFPANTPVEACIEVMRKSVVAMQCDPEGLDHWLDRARYSYERAMGRRLERDAQRDATNERVVAALKKGIIGAGAAMGDDPDAWKAALITSGNDKLANVGENVFIILAMDPRTCGSIRWNEVNKTIETHGGPFAGVDIDVLATTVCDWLMRHYRLSVASGEVADRIMRVAKLNRYNPLQDYLNALVWDRKPRIESFLIDYCGARCTNAAEDDITAYIKLISSRWFIAAVARALKPGCQVDNVLVLEGPQGKGKTSALRVLGGRWSCDTQLVLGDKDSKMLAACSWLIELAELASFKKSESEQMKAFLTARTDKYRRPYGRAITDEDRMCIFIGTTNEGTYLRDRTGNRRFWPCYVTSVDLARIAADRDQLWAEAVSMYHAGQRWWLTDDEQKLADVQTDERLTESAVEAKVWEWWTGTHPTKRDAHVTGQRIAETALGYQNAKDITPGVLTEIGLAMKALGFGKKRIEGRWYYVASETLLKVAQGKPWEVRLVQLAKVKNA